MATRTWTGTASGAWNLDANWGGTKPSAGDDLVFPLSPAGNKSNSNDYPADTSFNSITIQGTGYTLAGNRITLVAGITQTTGINTISLAIVLGAAVTVSVEEADLTLSGIISDGAGSAVAKTGTARLVLSGANTFTGGLTIKAGIVALTGNTSAGGGSGTGAIILGDTSGTAIATLFLVGLTFSNPVAVSTGSSGTKLVYGYGASLVGAITLADNVTIASNGGGSIGISGGITGTGNVLLSGYPIGSNSGLVTLSGTAINNTGTVTNGNAGTGTTTISAVVGAAVTAVIQSSSTSKLILSGAGVIANCADKLQITSGQLQLSTANTVANLFVDATGCTDKTAQLILAANQTVTTEFKPRGSVANPLLVTSETLGTARTITVTGATVSNSQAVDFRDITFANGGVNLTFAAITGGSGDCGGNTISGGGTLSFTTADDWYWYSAGAGTYNLSDRAYWFDQTGGAGTQMGADRGPLPQDSLHVDASSINGATIIDQDLPRMPGIDFTGTDAVAFHVNSVQQICYGSFIGSANVTYTGSSSYTLTMGSRGSVLLSPGSQITDNITIAAFGGTVTLGGNVDNGTGATITLSNGTLDADSYNVSCLTFVGSGTLSRTLLMGSGTWNVHAWTFTTTTNITSTAVGETSTISMGSATDSTARTFAGGGLAYYNWQNVANTSGTQIITISGNNAFTGTFTHNGPKTVKWTAGSVNTFGAFATTGTGIVIASSAAGSVYYFVDVAGTNTVSNATISDCYVNGTGDVPAGGALWRANDGTSTDLANNVDYDAATNRGWLFGEESSASSVSSQSTISSVSSISSSTISSLSSSTKSSESSPSSVSSLSTISSESSLSSQSTSSSESSLSSLSTLSSVSSSSVSSISSSISTVSSVSSASTLSSSSSSLAGMNLYPVAATAGLECRKTATVGGGTWSASATIPAETRA